MNGRVGMNRFDIARELPPPPPEPERKRPARQRLINAAIGVAIFGRNSKAVKIARNEVVGMALLSRKHLGDRRVLNGFFQVPLYQISRKNLKSLRAALHSHVDRIFDNAQQTIDTEHMTAVNTALDQVEQRDRLAR